MNPVRGNPYYDVLNYHRMNDIKNDRMLNGIYKEIVEGRKLIIRNQPTNNGKYVNVLNKEIPKKNKVGKTLSFFQFGYETKVLEIVNELIGDKMKVLIYDGWIGQKCDVSILETTIKQRLDLDILFDEELIVRPPISELS